LLRKVRLADDAPQVDEGNPMAEHRDDASLPKDDGKLEPSLTPTDAETDPTTVEDAEHSIEADSGLSGAGQQGGAALANLGRRRGSELFSED
jgi:hypothetical protein